MTTALQRTSLGELGRTSLGTTSLGELGTLIEQVIEFFGAGDGLDHHAEDELILAIIKAFVTRL